MLAAIRRTILGLGPEHFSSFFIYSITVPRFVRYWHLRHLEDPCDVVRQDYFSRSIYGMIAVYNWLPEFVVLAPSIKLFQHYLQQIVKVFAINQFDNWADSLCRNSSINAYLPSITQSVLENFSSFPVALCRYRLRSVD